MPEEEIVEDTERLKPPRIGEFGTRLDAQGDLEVYWYVENADTVEIQDFVEPTLDLDDSQAISITQKTVLTLIARNKTQIAQMSIAVFPSAKKEGSSIPDKSTGTSLHVLPDGSSHGFLIEKNELILSSEGLKQVDPGHCPRCDKQAPEWKPPVGDQRYDTAFCVHKQRLGPDATDDQIHAEFLRKTGGYVTDCTDCGTSFFVPVK